MDFFDFLSRTWHLSRMCSSFNSEGKFIHRQPKYTLLYCISFLHSDHLLYKMRSKRCYNFLSITIGWRKHCDVPDRVIRLFITYSLIESCIKYLNYIEPGKTTFTGGVDDDNDEEFRKNQYDECCYTCTLQTPHNKWSVLEWTRINIIENIFKSHHNSKCVKWPSNKKLNHLNYLKANYLWSFWYEFWNFSTTARYWLICCKAHRSLPFCGPHLRKVKLNKKRKNQTCFRTQDIHVWYFSRLELKSNWFQHKHLNYKHTHTTTKQTIQFMFKYFWSMHTYNVSPNHWFRSLLQAIKL